MGLYSFPIFLYSDLSTREMLNTESSWRNLRRFFFIQKFKNVKKISVKLTCKVSVKEKNDLSG